MPKEQHSNSWRLTPFRELYTKEGSLKKIQGPSPEAKRPELMSTTIGPIKEKVWMIVQRWGMLWGGLSE